MQFQADEEDGDFLIPGSSRSRLSSLFHSENPNPSGDVNQALTFTAPKQPKKNENAQGALKLIHAVVVHAHKLKDGNYSSQGKLGCAILGNHEICNYKLLLYKGKQIQVTFATITPIFIFHVQPNNYANFYDEKKENWSINFDSEGPLFEFVKQVTLAKANAQGKSPTALVMQDLVSGEGQPLENGDSAEVKYTGWLLSNFAFGPIFDSNMTADSLYRVRLGKSKVIKGWNEGITGIKKGGKRLLIVPPDLAYGSEGMAGVIPPHSTLIFEIHVVKVKTASDSSHSPSPVKVPDSAPEKKSDAPPRQSFSHDDNIRMRGASISEQLSQSPKKDKAQLISRMAKMGTATLPFHGAVPVQLSSDSESEVDAPQPSSPAPPNISRTSSPKPTAKPRSRTNSGPVIAAHSIPAQGAVPFQPPSLYDPAIMPAQSPICGATPFPTYPQQLPAHYAMLQSSFSMQNVPGMVSSVPTSVVDSHLPMLVTEARNQNTEVRISLSKITDKVDTILSRVDDMRLQGRSASTSVPFMEGNILSQNIERIIQENSRMKEDIEAKNFKIGALNEKICDLFQRNQRFFEESNNMLEQKSDSLQSVSAQSQEKILNLEQEKARLQLELSTISIKFNALEADVAKSQKIENELRQMLENAEKEAKTQESLVKVKEDHLNKLENVFTLQNSQIEKLKTIEEEKNLLAMKIESLEHSQSNSHESNELAEVYKREVEQYKEKIEQLNTAVNNNSKLLEEKETIRKELEDSHRLKNEMETRYKETLKKYEVFQEKTRALKERYDQVVNEIKHLQASKSVGTSPEFSAEIKKVMNALYKLLQGKFDPSTSYKGSEILEAVLQTIMGLTLQILERKNKSLGDHSHPPPESSKIETVSECQNTTSEESSQSESVQQNGIQDEESATSGNLLKTCVSRHQEPAENSAVTIKESATKEISNSNEASKVSSSTKVVDTTQADISVNEVTSEPIVNKNIEEIPQLDSALNAQRSDTVRSASPEMWRPQPPLFDDDDDDEDDDDDWLKRG